MSLPIRMRLGATALAALILAWPAQAAPKPKDSPSIAILKFLPDDTDAFAYVNVKQILASELFKKHYLKEAQGLLGMDIVKSVFKDCGFDPLKDIDQAAMGFARSTQSKQWPGPGEPFVIVQGRFDLDKFQAKLEELAKTYPAVVKVVDIGEMKGAEITSPGEILYAVALDKNTVFMAPMKEQVVDAQAKAAGKKKTDLKNKLLKKVIENIDPKQVVTLIGTGDMVVGGSTNFVGGQRVMKVTTMADEGVETIHGGFMIGDDIQGQATITTRDADSATKVGQNIEKGVGQAINELTRMAVGQKEFTPLVDGFKSIKVEVKDEKITMTGKGAPDLVKSFVNVIMFGRSAAGAVPPPAP